MKVVPEVDELNLYDIDSQLDDMDFAEELFNINVS